VRVPFVDLYHKHEALKHELLSAAEAIIDSSQFVLGGRLRAFEEDFASFCEVKHAIGVGCGLDALKIALQTLGVQQGDEVIVPAHTYIATWLAVSQINATIVPVDADPSSMNIDVSLIEQAITPKTKVIIPVHMYGYMCAMDKVMALAEKYDIKVLEDFAQAHGAIYQGRIAGSIGHVNATSFYPGKNLGALGDGGAVCCNSPRYAETISKLRNYGSQQKYYHEILGQNSRLDNLQAAFLQIKLRHLTQWNRERQLAAKEYTKNLQGTADLILPMHGEEDQHVYHLFVVRTAQREALRTFLENKGVSTIIHYPIPPHLQEAYAHLGYEGGSFPVAEKIASTALSLPMFPGITSDQIAYVCAQIKAFYKF